MKPSFCFAHVPKAGGSTFIHLLRRHFGLGHVDVIHRRPPGSVERVYRRRDFRADRRLMPWARSFAGHWLRPSEFPAEDFGNLRWFVILREPRARSLSQYHQDLDLGRLPAGTSFADWCGLELFGLRNRNAQCRQLCGREDAGQAIEIIASGRVRVGMLEEFDLSLLAWRADMGLNNFDLRYEKARNVRSSNPGRRERMAGQIDLDDALRHQNDQDEILYREVRSNLFLQWLQKLGGREKLEKIDPAPVNDAGVSAWSLRWNRLFRNLVYKPWVACDRLVSRSADWRKQTN